MKEREKETFLLFHLSVISGLCYPQLNLIPSDTFQNTNFGKAFAMFI